ncbi:MAG TPA: outer membrane beta-barrel protein [Anaeromyxobacter sp.]|nr:outer membrane beta-barrel protein [Anaeromyxobacter sp.]
MHVRSLSAVVLAALLAAPSMAHAQARKPAKAAAPAASAAPQYSVGGWIGYEMGDLDGLQLRADGIMPYKKLTPQIALSFVGSLGYSYLTHSESTSVPGFPSLTASVDSTVHLLKIVPAARFTLPLNPQLSFFGDAGLGFYYASLSVDTETSGVTQSVSDSSFGFMFRFGVGGLYQLNPRTQIGASLMLDPMLGDYDDSTFTLLAGLTYRL